MNITEFAKGTADPLMESTILLLVSDPVVRATLKETLDRVGYTIMAAGDLGQAVDRLKECTPDLLITRTYVQGMPGHDAAIYLRTKCMTMIVLILGDFSTTTGFNIGKRCKDLRSSPSPILWPNCFRR